MLCNLGSAVLQTAAKLSKTLVDAASSTQSDVELALPDKVGAMDLRPAALTKAANDVPTMQAFNDALTSWCKTVELLIQVCCLPPLNCQVYEGFLQLVPFAKVVASVPMQRAVPNSTCYDQRQLADCTMHVISPLVASVADIVADQGFVARKGSFTLVHLCVAIHRSSLNGKAQLC